MANSGRCIDFGGDSITITITACSRKSPLETWPSANNALFLAKNHRKAPYSFPKMARNWRHNLSYVLLMKWCFTVRMGDWIGVSTRYEYRIM
mmetsp:Transcript_10803/g.21785  ORF Transcript_10803/g.21785 Transcript_10803/m.21785 type:complete len:92 (+) Transcript_10803:2853-3128(+)